MLRAPNEANRNPSQQAHRIVAAAFRRWADDNHQSSRREKELKSNERSNINNQTLNSPSVSDIDPLVAYADAVSPRHIVGKLLRFIKGDYFAG